MKDIHILIVDDEVPARKKLRTYLIEEQGIESIEEAENGVEAVNMIQKNKPDMVFLDIQMPGLTGFEIIETIGVENMPTVVFVTAYDQYAINAFEVHAVDYLLKPFDQERFQKSFYRAKKQIEWQQNHVSILNGLLHEIKKEPKYRDRIMVNIGQRYFYVKTSDIMFISAEEKYVNLHTEKEIHLMRETMNNMEHHLDPAKFKRIHRSYIVNIDFIREIQPYSHGDYVVILKNGRKLTLSRRFRERLFGKD
jgi:two-component system LytT family response regulator